jgi:hypothetical protein
VTGEPGAASYRIKLRRFCPSAWFARLYRLSCQHRSWTETEQGLALIALSVTTHGSQIKTLCVRQFLSQVDHLVDRSIGKLRFDRSSAQFTPARDCLYAGPAFSSLLQQAVRNASRPPGKVEKTRPP